MTPATGRSILAGIIDLVSDFRRWLAVCQHLPLANCNRISGWPEFQDGAAAMVEAKERALIAHPPVAGFDLAILHGAWRDVVPFQAVKLHEGAEGRITEVN